MRSGIRGSRRRWHISALIVSLLTAAALLALGSRDSASALPDTDGRVTSATAEVGELFTVSVELDVDAGEPDVNFDSFIVTLTWDPALASVERPEDTFMLGAPFVADLGPNPVLPYEINAAAGTIRVTATDTSEPAECFPGCTLFTVTFKAKAGGSGPLTVTAAGSPSISGNGSPISGAWDPGTLTITGPTATPPPSPTPSPSATATATATLSPSATPSPSPSPELDYRIPLQHVARDGVG